MNMYAQYGCCGTAEKTRCYVDPGTMCKVRFVKTRCYVDPGTMCKVGVVVSAYLCGCVRVDLHTYASQYHGWCGSPDKYAA